MKQNHHINKKLILKLFTYILFLIFLNSCSQSPIERNIKVFKTFGNRDSKEIEGELFYIWEL